jgi:heme-degrading monooxygenase HmoA
MIAQTPNPPYYAVIFSSIKSDQTEGYDAMAESMANMVVSQPGYLGHESARDGIGITVSYWDSLAAIKNWKLVSEHQEAQAKGRTNWYQSYKTRICKVERDYEFEQMDDSK